MITTIYYNKQSKKVTLGIILNEDNTITHKIYENAYPVYAQGVVTIYQSNDNESKPAQKVLVTSLVNTVIIFE